MPNRNAIAKATVGGLLMLRPISAYSGSTWALTSAPAGSWNACCSSADGRKLTAVLGSGGGIYTSTNSGATWTPDIAPPEYPSEYWGALASSADGVKLVAAVSYVAGPQESRLPAPLYLSTNSGASWVQATAPSNYWYSVASSADGTTLTAAANGGGIYLSTDSGATWTPTQAPTNTWTSIACSTNGARLVAAADGDGVYLSTNSGASWSKANVSIAHYPAVASSADGARLVALDEYASSFADGAVFTSADSGASWTPAGVPAAGWRALASSADGSKLAAGAAYDAGLGPGLIFTSADAGTNWADSSAPPGMWNSIASSYDGNKLVAAADTGIYTWPAVPPLNISYSANGVRISWPAFAAACVLEQSDELSPTNWLSSSETVNDDGTNRFVLVYPAPGKRFYRLTKP